MKRRKMWNIHEMMEWDYSSLESILTFSGKKDYLLVFKVGEEKYGLEIESVRELVRYDLKNPPKAIPNVPFYIVGVVNVRGEILPVMDLRKKIGFPPKEPSAFDVIVIVEKENLLMGLLTDEVEDVVPFPEKRKMEVPSYLEKIDTSFVQFLCEYREGIVTILDLDKLLDEGGWKP